MRWRQASQYSPSSLAIDAHGIDPFVKTETAYVRRAYLRDTTAKECDLNHVPSFARTHERSHRRASCSEGELAPAELPVRIPIVNWAWKTTRRMGFSSMRRGFYYSYSPELSFGLRRGGLRASHITFDSGPFQFLCKRTHERIFQLTEVRSTSSATLAALRCDR